MRISYQQRMKGRTYASQSETKNHFRRLYGWVIERTFGWLSRSRRLSKDYERKVQTSETLIQIAMIRLLIARLGRGN